MDYSRINNSLNTEAEPARAREVNVSIVALGGVRDVQVTSGMTVREFKERNNLSGKTVADADGNVLSANDIISDDMEVFISTPKQNG